MPARCQHDLSHSRTQFDWAARKNVGLTAADLMLAKTAQAIKQVVRFSRLWASRMRRLHFLLGVQAVIPSVLPLIQQLERLTAFSASEKPVKWILNLMFQMDLPLVSTT